MYALKEQDETFLKIPKSRRCVKALNNEAGALKELTSLLIPTLFLENAQHLGILMVQSVCEKARAAELEAEGLGRISYFESRRTGIEQGRSTKHC